MNPQADDNNARMTCAKCQSGKVNICITIQEEASMIVEELLQCRSTADGIGSSLTISEEASRIVEELLAVLQNELNTQ